MERAASFEETLTRLAEQQGVEGPGSAELALEALFGDGLATSGKAQAATDGSPEAGTEASHEARSQGAPPSPASYAPANEPANDDFLPPAAPTRARRRLAFVLVILAIAAVCAVACVAGLQVDLGARAPAIRFGLIGAVAAAALALCVFLHDLAALQRQASDTQAAHWIWLAGQIARRDGASTHDDQASPRTAIGADIASIREQLDRIDQTYGPAANRSAEIAAFAARIAKLEGRMTDGFEATEAKLASLQVDLRRTLAVGEPPPVVTKPAPGSGDLRFPFDLFCDGLAVMFEDKTTFEDKTIFEDKTTDMAHPALHAARAVLDTVFDADRLSRVWERYRQDGRADFDSAYIAGGLDVMARVRARLAIDPALDGAVEIFMARYESLITAAAQSNQAIPLETVLADTRGHCYTLLAHAAGRLSQSSDMSADADGALAGRP